MAFTRISQLTSPLPCAIPPDERLRTARDLAIILYMTVLPVAEARASLSRLIDSAVSTHERTTITRNGVPAAVLLSVDDYESMQETIEILADRELMAAIREGLDDLAAGRVHDQADVTQAMREAGRL